MEPACTGPAAENPSGRSDRQCGCRRRRRRGAGKRRCALMMQDRADLAIVLRHGRRQRSGGVVEARGRAAARGPGEPVVMPAEQECLEQDRRDADQRDPAARPHPGSEPARAHGFIVAGAASSRRRHAWVALTKLVTPTPSTANTSSRNGRPSVSRLWTRRGVLTATSAIPGNAKPNSPNSQCPRRRGQRDIADRFLRQAAPYRPGAECRAGCGLVA